MSWTSWGRCCFRSTQWAASLRTFSASATAAARTCFSRANSDSARSRSLRRFCFCNCSSSARDWPALASEVAARPRRSGYARAEGRARKRALSLARLRETSACADWSCDCAAVNALRSAEIWALTAPGRPSRPAKRTTRIPTVNRTARIRNDDLLISCAYLDKVKVGSKTAHPRGKKQMAADKRRLTPINADETRCLSAFICVYRRPFLLRLAVDRDVSRVEPRGQRDREWLAFNLLDSHQALPVLGEKLPVVEARGRRFVIAPGAYFAAQPVHPGCAIEIERVGGILPLVHLRQVVLAQGEIFQGDFARVGVKKDFHLFIAADPQGHAALQVGTGKFHPGPRTRLEARAAVHGVIQIVHAVARSRNGEDISRAGVGDLQVRQILHRPYGRGERLRVFLE